MFFSLSNFVSNLLDTSFLPLSLFCWSVDYVDRLFAIESTLRLHGFSISSFDLPELLPINLNLQGSEPDSPPPKTMIP